VRGERLDAGDSVHISGSFHTSAFFRSADAVLAH